MRDTEYWKKELGEMHPTEYIALIEAITEANHCKGRKIK